MWNTGSDPVELDGLGVMVGLAEEARLIRRLLPYAPIALSHAHEVGAQRALRALHDAGVTRLLSFGCAGGLAPSVMPGTVLVADRVHDNGCSFAVDDSLSHCFGATHARRGGVLHRSIMVARAAEKQRLWRESGCLAVDMESGVVARSGLPFAVLRVVCDDATCDLPPAAVVAMKEGQVHFPALLTSLVCHPGQLGALLRLGRKAVRARRAMAAFLAALV